MKWTMVKGPDPLPDCPTSWQLPRWNKDLELQIELKNGKKWCGMVWGRDQSILCSWEIQGEKNHSAKSQQSKLEITCPTPKLPPWPPFEYTSKAALVSTALFPAQACKGTKQRKWRNHLGASFLILEGLVASNFPVVTESPGDYKEYKEILTSDLDLEGFL